MLFVLVRFCYIFVYVYRFENYSYVLVRFLSYIVERYFIHIFFVNSIQVNIVKISGTQYDGRP